MSTCNRLDLQTLGSQPIMPKNLPDHCLGELLEISLPKKSVHARVVGHPQRIKKNTCTKLTTTCMWGIYVESGIHKLTVWRLAHKVLLIYAKCLWMQAKLFGLHPPAKWWENPSTILWLWRRPCTFDFWTSSVVCESKLNAFDSMFLFLFSYMMVSQRQFVHIEKMPRWLPTSVVHSA